MLVMPVPPMVRKPFKKLSEKTVMVNPPAPASNTIPFTSKRLDASTITSVVLDTRKVAVSLGPLGTVAGVQSVAKFQ